VKHGEIGQIKFIAKAPSAVVYEVRAKLKPLLGIH